MAWIRQTFSDCPSVKVSVYEGLTVDFCNRCEASYILRGLRTSADFEFESTIAHLNRQMMPRLETVFMLAEPEFAALNSSIVREIIRYKGDAGKFVPAAVIEGIRTIIK